MQNLVILGHQNGADLLILSDLNCLYRQEACKMYFPSALHTLGGALTAPSDQPGWSGEGVSL